MSWITRAVVIAMMIASPGLAHAGRTFGLAIGINGYSYVTPLDGARNDALDIANALRQTGATRVVTLLDGEASKKNVVDAWQSILAEARSGDVIFLSYAGHGAQTQELKPGDEKDGLDEFWVLAGFNPKDINGTWQETIFDNELFAWFTQASLRGVRVVLIADSCHAGGMARAVTGKLRYVRLGQSRLLAELVAMLLRKDQSGQEAPSHLPDNVTMLAATSEALPVPEVVIGGHSRGALSWSVARAIEGMADRDGNGVITRSEMEDYIYATVRIRSESLQTPVFTPLVARSADELVFNVGRTLAMAMAGKKAGQGPLPMARELGFEPRLAMEVKGADMPRDTVSGARPFVWDATRAVVMTPNGDIAAEGVDKYTIDDVVQKFILVDFLKALASRNPGRIAVRPEKSLYLGGDRIKFEITPNRYKNMIVFNLTNTGDVQYIDMVADGTPVGKTPLQEIQVVEPFGADHIVTISSDEPLDSISISIRHGVKAKYLLNIISERLDGVDSAVAILPLYTRQN